MQELLIIGLAFCALMSLVLSGVFIKFGEIIDRSPGGEEEKRDRSRWSPVEFSRISVMIFWPLFLCGGLMVLQQSKILMVLGIAIIFGLILFLLTAVLFSLSVVNLMKSHKSGNGILSPGVAGERTAGEKKPSRFLPVFRFPKKGKYPRVRSSVHKK